MKNPLYYKFARNEYSQFGEDGIIEHILATLPSKDGWCVEFGAWDGIHLSNTYNLIKNCSYTPVLIEANKSKFDILKTNMRSFNAVLVNEFVTFDGNNTLDGILARTAIPSDFDFLSIDIDGNDFWILDSIKRYRPKVICIEYNPSIPNDVEYIQARNFSVQKGASALSICKLARTKGYELVATTRCNLLLIAKEYSSYFQINNNELENMRDDEDCKVAAFVGYDGTIIFSRPLHFYWHDFTINEQGLQFLPKLLRKFPSDYNFLQKILFGAFLLYKQPLKTYKRLYFKIRSCVFRKH